jgi:leucyl/phenylalanyl-tRNA--protein transferase
MILDTSVKSPFWIDEHDPEPLFPPVEFALDEPNGLLAVGGDLSPERLIHAYRHGIFPWYSDDQPILWWSPDPRAVLFPEQLHISRSLYRAINRTPFEITLDKDFAAVMQGCAAPRRDGLGTWLTEEMQAAYLQLHRMGIAHSIEAWRQNELVGGLYGLAIGGVFFGESMFSRADNASKIAFVYLVKQLQQWNYGMIDCQISSDHLTSLGAVEIERREFMTLLARYLDRNGKQVPWQFDEEFSPLYKSTAR